MVTEREFDEIQKRAKAFAYTSFTHLDYDECRYSDILHDDQRRIVLMDRHDSIARIHFATDDFMLLMPVLSVLNMDVQINFVPHAYREPLEAIEFFPWAEYIDFFNMHLPQTPIGDTHFDRIEFLSPDESRRVSIVSQRCANQSRGFTGETEEWFVDWTRENDVIIVRQNDDIAGFCCVSIYNDGTTLWIREIAVDPDCQGKGFGKKLMEQAICYGRSKKAVKGFLAADLLNHNAIALYGKYGFVSKKSSGELQMRRLVHA